MDPHLTGQPRPSRVAAVVAAARDRPSGRGTPAARAAAADSIHCSRAFERTRLQLGRFTFRSSSKAVGRSGSAGRRARGLMPF
ncbi:DUF6411 family protein [Streptomyces sp. NPDC056353]|uniref:DUF6411 family protein n=1 Tax=Streptomyces sp. NPDC056353 TaxID=3345792 RepID=UPI0035D721E2